MYMFEEGFGSYRRDRFDNSKGLKNIINKLTGVGDHIGFQSFLQGSFFICRICIGLSSRIFKIFEIIPEALC